MYENNGRLTGGLFLIFTGVVLLLINQGFLDWNFWRLLWDYWPVLLILAGINVLAGKRVGGMITFGVLLILLGLAVLFSAGSSNARRSGTWSTSEGPSGRITRLESPLEPGVTRAEMRVDFGAGDLNIGDVTPALAAGLFDTPDWRRPEFRTNRNGSEVDVHLRERGGNWPNFDSHPDARWSVNLNGDIPWEITVKAGAGNLRMDLSTYRVNRFQLDVGAVSSYIKFGDREDQVHVSLHTGASSTTLAVPRNAGLKITLEGALVSMKGNDFTREGLIQSGSVYTSPNYATAKTKINMDISAGAASFDLERY